MAGKPNVLLKATAKRGNRTELIASGWAEPGKANGIAMVLEGSYSIDGRTGVKALVLNDGTVVTTGKDGDWYLNVLVY